MTARAVRHRPTLIRTVGVETMVDDVELTERTMAEEIWQRLVDTTAPARRAGYLNGLDHMVLITREELETALDEAARTPSPVSVEEAVNALISEVSRQTNARWPINGLVDDVLDFNALAIAALSARP